MGPQILRQGLVALAYLALIFFILFLNISNSIETTIVIALASDNGNGKTKNGKTKLKASTNNINSKNTDLEKGRIAESKQHASDGDYSDPDGDDSCSVTSDSSESGESGLGSSGSGSGSEYGSGESDSQSGVSDSESELDESMNTARHSRTSLIQQQQQKIYQKQNQQKQQKLRQKKLPSFGLFFDNYFHPHFRSDLEGQVSKINNIDVQKGQNQQTQTQQQEQSRFRFAQWLNKYFNWETCCARCGQSQTRCGDWNSNSSSCSCCNSCIYQARSWIHTFLWLIKPVPSPMEMHFNQIFKDWLLKYDYNIGNLTLEEKNWLDVHSVSHQIQVGGVQGFQQGMGNLTLVPQKSDINLEQIRLHIWEEQKEELEHLGGTWRQMYGDKYYKQKQQWNSASINSFSRSASTSNNWKYKQQRHWQRKSKTATDYMRASHTRSEIGALLYKSVLHHRKWLERWSQERDNVANRDNEQVWKWNNKQQNQNVSQRTSTSSTKSSQNRNSKQGSLNWALAAETRSLLRKSDDGQLSGTSSNATTTASNLEQQSKSPPTGDQRQSKRVTIDEASNLDIDQASSSNQQEQVPLLGAQEQGKGQWEKESKTNTKSKRQAKREQKALRKQQRKEERQRQRQQELEYEYLLSVEESVLGSMGESPYSSYSHWQSDNDCHYKQGYHYKPESQCFGTASFDHQQFQFQQPQQPQPQQQQHLPLDQWISWQVVNQMKYLQMTSGNYYECCDQEDDILDDDLDWDFQRWDQDWNWNYQDLQVGEGQNETQDDEVYDFDEFGSVRQLEEWQQLQQVEVELDVQEGQDGVVQLEKVGQINSRNGSQIRSWATLTQWQWKWKSQSGQQQQQSKFLRAGEQSKSQLSNIKVKKESSTDTQQQPSSSKTTSISPSIIEKVKWRRALQAWQRQTQNDDNANGNHIHNLSHNHKSNCDNKYQYEAGSYSHITLLAWGKINAEASKKLKHMLQNEVPPLEVLSQVQKWQKFLYYATLGSYRSIFGKLIFFILWNFYICQSIATVWYFNGIQTRDIRAATNTMTAGGWVPQGDANSGLGPTVGGWADGGGSGGFDPGLFGGANPIQGTYVGQNGSDIIGNETTSASSGQNVHVGGVFVGGSAGGSVFVGGGNSLVDMENAQHEQQTANGTTDSSLPHNYTDEISQNTNESWTWSQDQNRTGWNSTSSGGWGLLGDFNLQSLFFNEESVAGATYSGTQEENVNPFLNLNDDENWQNQQQNSNNEDDYKKLQSDGNDDKTDDKQTKESNSKQDKKHSNNIANDRTRYEKPNADVINALFRVQNSLYNYDLHKIQPKWTWQWIESQNWQQSVSSAIYEFNKREYFNLWNRGWPDQLANDETDFSDGQFGGQETDLNDVNMNKPPPPPTPPFAPPPMPANAPPKPPKPSGSGTSQWWYDSEKGKGLSMEKYAMILTVLQLHTLRDEIFEGFRLIEDWGIWLRELEEDYWGVYSILYPFGEDEVNSNWNNGTGTGSNEDVVVWYQQSGNESNESSLVVDQSQWEIGNGSETQNQNNYTDLDTNYTQSLDTTNSTQEQQSTQQQTQQEQQHQYQGQVNQQQNKLLLELQQIRQYKWVLENKIKQEALNTKRRIENYPHCDLEHKTKMASFEILGSMTVAGSGWKTGLTVDLADVLWADGDDELRDKLFDSEKVLASPVNCTWLMDEIQTFPDKKILEEIYVFLVSQEGDEAFRWFGHHVSIFKIIDAYQWLGQTELFQQLLKASQMNPNIGQNLLWKNFGLDRLMDMALWKALSLPSWEWQQNLTQLLISNQSTGQYYLDSLTNKNAPMIWKYVEDAGYNGSLITDETRLRIYPVTIIPNINQVYQLIFAMFDDLLPDDDGDDFPIYADAEEQWNKDVAQTTRNAMLPWLGQLRFNPNGDRGYETVLDTQGKVYWLLHSMTDLLFIPREERLHPNGYMPLMNRGSGSGTTLRVQYDGPNSSNNDPRFRTVNILGGEDPNQQPYHSFYQDKLVKQYYEVWQRSQWRQWLYESLYIMLKHKLKTRMDDDGESGWGGGSSSQWWTSSLAKLGQIIIDRNPINIGLKYFSYLVLENIFYLFLMGLVWANLGYFFQNVSLKQLFRMDYEQQLLEQKVEYVEERIMELQEDLEREKRGVNSGCGVGGRQSYQGQFQSSRASSSLKLKPRRRLQNMNDFRRQGQDFQGAHDVLSQSDSDLEDESMFWRQSQAIPKNRSGKKQRKDRRRSSKLDPNESSQQQYSHQIQQQQCNQIQNSKRSSVLQQQNTQPEQQNQKSLLHRQYKHDPATEKGVKQIFKKIIQNKNQVYSAMHYTKMYRHATVSLILIGFLIVLPIMWGLRSLEFLQHSTQSWEINGKVMYQQRDLINSVRSFGLSVQNLVWWHGIPWLYKQDVFVNMDNIWQSGQVDLKLLVGQVWNWGENWEIQSQIWAGLEAWEDQLWESLADIITGDSGGGRRRERQLLLDSQHEHNYWKLQQNNNESMHKNYMSAREKELSLRRWLRVGQREKLNSFLEHGLQSIPFEINASSLFGNLSKNQSQNRWKTAEQGQALFQKLVQDAYKSELLKKLQDRNAFIQDSALDESATFRTQSQGDSFKQNKASDKHIFELDIKNTSINKNPNSKHQKLNLLKRRLRNLWVVITDPPWPPSPTPPSSPPTPLQTETVSLEWEVPSEYQTPELENTGYRPIMDAQSMEKIQIDALSLFLAIPHGSTLFYTEGLKALNQLSPTSQSQMLWGVDVDLQSGRRNRVYKMSKRLMERMWGDEAMYEIALEEDEFQEEFYGWFESWIITGDRGIDKWLDQLQKDVNQGVSIDQVIEDQEWLVKQAQEVYSQLNDYENGTVSQAEYWWQQQKLLKDTINRGARVLDKDTLLWRSEWYRDIVRSEEESLNTRFTMRPTVLYSFPQTQMNELLTLASNINYTLMEKVLQVDNLEGSDLRSLILKGPNGLTDKWIIKFLDSEAHSKYTISSWTKLTFTVLHYVGWILFLLGCFPWLWLLYWWVHGTRTLWDSLHCWLGSHGQKHRLEELVNHKIVPRFVAWIKSIQDVKTVQMLQQERDLEVRKLMEITQKMSQGQGQGQQWIQQQNNGSEAGTGVQSQRQTQQSWQSSQYSAATRSTSASSRNTSSTTFTSSEQTPNPQRTLVTTQQLQENNLKQKLHQLKSQYISIKKRLDLLLLLEQVRTTEIQTAKRYTTNFLTQASTILMSKNYLLAKRIQYLFMILFVKFFLILQTIYIEILYLIKWHQWYWTGGFTGQENDDGGESTGAPMMSFGLEEEMEGGGGKFAPNPNAAGGSGGGTYTGGADNDGTGTGAATDPTIGGGASSAVTGEYHTGEFWNTPHWVANEAVTQALQNQYSSAQQGAGYIPQSEAEYFNIDPGNDGLLQECLQAPFYFIQYIGGWYEQIGTSNNKGSSSSIAGLIGGSGGGANSDNSAGGTAGQSQFEQDFIGSTSQLEGCATCSWYSYSVLPHPAIVQYRSYSALISFIAYQLFYLFLLWGWLQMVVQRFVQLSDAWEVLKKGSNNWLLKQQKLRNQQDLRNIYKGLQVELGELEEKIGEVIEEMEKDNSGGEWKLQLQCQVGSQESERQSQSQFQQGGSSSDRNTNAESTRSFASSQQTNTNTGNINSAKDKTNNTINTKIKIQLHLLKFHLKKYKLQIQKSPQAKKIEEQLAGEGIDQGMLQQFSDEAGEEVRNSLQIQVMGSAMTSERLYSYQKWIFIALWFAVCVPFIQATWWQI